jgi:hypothetical protein
MLAGIRAFGGAHTGAHVRANRVGDDELRTRLTDLIARAIADAKLTGP